MKEPCIEMKEERRKKKVRESKSVSAQEKKS